MSAPRRTASSLVLLGLLALPALACTRGCHCGPRHESFVEAPTTVAALRARHRPPHAVVHVARRTRAQGGGACGHSPLCLVLLPLLVYEAVFPERYQVGTLTEGGATTFVGSFTDDGDLIHARVRTDAAWREIGLLALPELGVRAIVERARVERLADGGDGRRTPTAVLPQIDLVARYDRALARESSPARRARLVLEAAEAAGPELHPFVRARLSRADLDDAERAAVVARVCQAGVQPHGLREAVRAIAAAQGGVRTAEAARGCFTLPADVALAGRMLRALTAAVCDAAEPERPWQALSGWTDTPAARDVAVDAARRCAGHRGVLVRALLLDPVAPEALDAALSARAAEPLWLRALRPVDPTHRAAIVRRLTDPRRDGLSPGLLAAARNLRPLARTLDADTVLRLAASIPTPIARDDQRLRHALAETVSDALAAQPALRSRVLDVLRDRPDASPPDRDAVTATRVLLGDARAVPTAFRATSPVAPYDHAVRELPLPAADYCALALQSSGCDGLALRDGQRAAREGAPLPRCRGPARR